MNEKEKPVGLERDSHALSLPRLLWAVVIGGVWKMITPRKKQTLPRQIGGLTLVARLQKEAVTQDTLQGIYQDADGRKVFVKRWEGRVRNFSYYVLKNEIAAYEALNFVIAHHRHEMPARLRTVRVPKLLHFEETPRCVTALIEFVDGEKADVRRNGEKYEFYLRVSDFLRYAGEHMTDKERTLISTRAPQEYLFLYPFLLIRAVLLHSNIAGKLLRGMVPFVRGVPALFSHTRREFVHRDLHFRNILSAGSEIILVDLEFCVFTEPLQELITALRYAWGNAGLRERLLALIRARHGERNNFRRLFQVLAVNSVTHGLTHGGRTSRESVKRNVDFLEWAKEGNWIRQVDSGDRKRTTGVFSRGMRIFRRVERWFVQWRQFVRTKKLPVRVLFFIFCALILGMSVRGIPGNPTSEELNTNRWQGGPFETSNDRGRFALTYSLMEDKSFQFSLPVAKFATSDVAITKDGKYVSLFAPATAIVVIPGYVAGKYFGAAQVGTFATIALFAFINILLLRSIALRLGVSSTAANIGALVFAFATPAFAYSVTLSQHHVSTFFILAGFYILLRWNTLWAAAIFWLLYGMSVTVDYPNLFLMFPLAVYSLRNALNVRKLSKAVTLAIRPMGVLVMAAVLIPAFMLMWFNYKSHGEPLKLSGTLERVKAIDENGKPTRPEIERILGVEKESDPNAKKTVFGFFNSRNLLNGFYIHLVSPDRGIIKYAPVMVFGVIGLIVMYRKRSKFRTILLTVALVDLLLYSLWWDPYGGWSFGSRYLIPAYAMLSLGVAAVVSRWRSGYLLSGLFLVVFGISVWINSLGALTSNQNPPRVEVLALEKAYGNEQKYTYQRNWDFLHERGSRSFVYKTLAHKFMSAPQYHALITTMIIAVAVGMTGWMTYTAREERRKNIVRDVRE